jgi:ATP-dependent RNA helicase DDX3X
LRQIVFNKGMPATEDRQTVMFSATFPSEIQKLAADFLRARYIYLQVGQVGSTTDNIKQIIKNVDDSDKMIELEKDLKAVEGRTIVFTETKRTADYVGQRLCRLCDCSCHVHLRSLSCCSLGVRLLSCRV